MTAPELILGDLPQRGVDLTDLLSPLPPLTMVRGRHGELHSSRSCILFRPPRRGTGVQTHSLLEVRTHLCPTCWIPCLGYRMNSDVLFEWGPLAGDIAFLAHQEKDLKRTLPRRIEVVSETCFSDRDFLFQTASLEESTPALTPWSSVLREGTRERLRALLDPERALTQFQLFAPRSSIPRPGAPRVLIALPWEETFALSAPERDYLLSTEVSSRGRFLLCVLPEPPASFCPGVLQSCPLPSLDLLETLLEMWDPSSEGLFRTLPGTFEVASRV